MFNCQWRYEMKEQFLEPLHKSDKPYSGWKRPSRQTLTKADPAKVRRRRVHEDMKALKEIEQQYTF